ncbi:MAG: DUF1194 domain-containing protein [Pseudomonadota bacterium]
MRRFAGALAVAFVTAGPSVAQDVPEPAEPAEPVDLELVFAVDVSRSMDFDEQLLQREGYAEALTDPAVLQAIRSGAHQRIAVAYLEWGGPWAHRVVLDWMMIETLEDAQEASDWLRAFPIEPSSGTSISAGLERAAAMIEENRFDGVRKVIDISGDGPNNTGDPVHEVRDRLVEAGYEINGLPLLLKRPAGFFNIPDLDIYYEDCVIGGPSAFVLPVQDRAQIRSAIRLKMVMEISGAVPPARAARLRNAALPDCLIGERLRREWLDIRGRD